MQRKSREQPAHAARGQGEPEDLSDGETTVLSGAA